MNEYRLLIRALLVLCIFGIGLTIAADEWTPGRRWKIGVSLLIIMYAVISGLRPPA